MIKIRFFSSFCSEENCIDAYTRICELDNDPLYNSAYCFVKTDDYTHAVIINIAMPELKIPKKNVVGLAFEPFEYLQMTPSFVEYAKKNIGTYFIGRRPVEANLPDLFKEHFGYLWYITPLKETPVKKNTISLMISDKYYSEGHKYRHMLCSKILKSKLPVDIYGNGCKFYSFFKDPRIKGNFDNLEPYLNYVYHIAIENHFTPHYFSEKIINPLLCDTVPVYLGCKNIDSYFPNQVIHLSGDVNKDFELLKSICLKPEHYKKKIEVDEVKKKVSISRLVKTLGWVL